MRTSRRSRVCATVAVFALVVIAVPAAGWGASLSAPASISSSASDSTKPSVLDPEDDLPILTEDEALAKDAAEFARLKGTSQATAETALSAARELAPVTGELRELLGDREVSITKKYFPTTRLVVEISGKEKIPGVDEIVMSSPHPVLVSYVDKPGIEQLNQILRAATPAWEKAFPQVTRTTVDDSNPSRILVFVSADASAPDVAQLRELAPAVPASVTMSVRADREVDTPLAHDRTPGLLPGFHAALDIRRVVTLCLQPGCGARGAAAQVAHDEGLDGGVKLADTGR